MGGWSEGERWFDLLGLAALFDVVVGAGEADQVGVEVCEAWSRVEMGDKRAAVARGAETSGPRAHP